MSKIPSLNGSKSLINNGQATLIQSRIVSSSLKNYMDLSIQDASNNIKNVLVLPNREYVVLFYDSNYGAVRSITGLITDMWDDQIKMKYVSKDCDQIQCYTCKNAECPHRATITSVSASDGTSRTTAYYMPTCNCFMSTNATNKYDAISSVFIPVSNIITVSSTSPCNNDKYNCNDKKPENKLESEHKVMVLGISASVVRAIVLHLEFIDDSIEEALKYVDLVVGNTYDVSYESNTTHGCHDHQTVYEIRGKLVKIEEINDDMGCACKNGKGFVRENIGLDNSVYACCYSSKEVFLKASPISGIKLIFDTSENFYGRYETIMLSSIRDCTLVSAENEEEGSDNECTGPSACINCIHKTDSCNPHCCPHCTPPVIHVPDCDTCNKEFHRVYDYKDEMIKAEINGDTVSIMHSGVSHEVPLEEIMKVYLGI